MKLVAFAQFVQIEKSRKEFGHSFISNVVSVQPEHKKHATVKKDCKAVRMYASCSRMSTHRSFLRSGFEPMISRSGLTPVWPMKLLERSTERRSLTGVVLFTVFANRTNNSSRTPALASVSDVTVPVFSIALHSSSICNIAPSHDETCCKIVTSRCVYLVRGECVVAVGDVGLVFDKMADRVAHADVNALRLVWNATSFISITNFEENDSYYARTQVLVVLFQCTVTLEEWARKLKKNLSFHA